MKAGRIFFHLQIFLLPTELPLLCINLLNDDSVSLLANWSGGRLRCLPSWTKLNFFPRHFVWDLGDLGFGTRQTGGDSFTVMPDFSFQCNVQSAKFWQLYVDTHFLFANLISSLHALQDRSKPRERRAGPPGDSDKCTVSRPYLEGLARISLSSLE